MWGSFQRQVERRQVVVNMVGGNAISGVLFKQDGPLLVLKNAAYHEGRNEPTPLDGDVVIERANVLWIQAP